MTNAPNLIHTQVQDHYAADARIAPAGRLACRAPNDARLPTAPAIPSTSF